MKTISRLIVRIAKHMRVPAPFLLLLPLLHFSVNAYCEGESVGQVAESYSLAPGALPGPTTFYYVRDASHQLVLDQLVDLPKSQWYRVKQDVPSLGFSSDTIWFRFSYTNMEHFLADYILLYDFSLVDNIAVNVLDSLTQSVLFSYQTGDRYPFASRPIDNIAFAFPISLMANQTVDIYVKIRTQGSIVFPVSMWEKDAFYNKQQEFYLLYGIILGVLLITAIYNVVTFFRVKEVVFLYLAFFSLCALAMFLSYRGIAYEFFWPDWVEFNERSIGFFISLTCIFNFLFTRKFLRTEGLMDNIYTFFVYIFLICAVCTIFFPFASMLKPMLGIIVLAVVFTVYCGCSLWATNSFPMGKSFIVVWTIFLFGVLTSVAIRFGYIPYNFYTEFAVTFGSLATVGFLSMAVTDKIAKEKQDRIAAQNQSIKNLEKFESLYDNSVEGLYASTLSGVLIGANPAFVKMLGYESLDQLKELFNSNFFKIYLDSDEQYRLINLLEKEGCIIDEEIELTRADGTVFWASTVMRLVPKPNREDSIIEGSMIDITERKESERQLAFLARHDPLTNLYNRHEFETQLGQALENVRSFDANYCVLYMDLDQFKVVNDTCGHSAGDLLLRQLTKMLVVKLDKDGIIARLGGDEFGVLLKNSDIDKACDVAENFRQIIQSYRFSYDNRVFHLGVSIGVVKIAKGSESIDLIMSLADTACYSAKDEGRNRVHVYSADNRQLQKRRSEMELISAIHNALQSDSFVLYHQPILGCAAGANVFGMEVLLRLKNENGEMYPTEQLIGAAEHYHIMPKLDRWIVERSFAWLHQNLESLRRIQHCSINLSGQTLGDEGFGAYVYELFQKYSIAPEKICFEITESSAIQNFDLTIALIEPLRELGCRFALDDFGTGFSSYSYLQMLPIDYVKIDGSFVSSIASDPIAFAMVKSINDVARAMNVKTIAEYVDSPAAVLKLQQIQVDYLQGYSIAKPTLLSNFNAGWTVPTEEYSG